MHQRSTIVLMFSVLSMAAASGVVAQQGISLKPKQHVCYIGNGLADRMQHHAWLETYIHALHPEHHLTFRNLGFSGDEVKTRSRSANFGSPDQWLEKCRADVVFCFFGYNEALRGREKLPQFEQDLVAMIEGMRAKKYNGKSAPRLVIFSPIAHENVRSPHLPDGTENNQKLALYADAMGRICEERRVRFVNLFAITQRLYSQSKQPLTLNGIHLLEHGNQAVAQETIRELFPGGRLQSEDRLQRIRAAVLDKNYHWFSRYRVVDGYNVYGGRSKLAWHGQSNADVMRREMEVFDVMTANRDRRVWAVAAGGEHKVVDNNIPTLLKVKTNRRGSLPDGRFPYIAGKKAIEKMKVADGMRVKDNGGGDEVGRRTGKGRGIQDL